MEATPGNRFAHKSRLFFSVFLPSLIGWVLIGMPIQAQIEPTPKNNFAPSNVSTGLSSAEKNSTTTGADLPIFIKDPNRLFPTTMDGQPGVLKGSEESRTTNDSLAPEQFSLWETMALSIFNKQAPEREWTPLLISDFFDGWLQPHIAPGATTGGSLRQGWSGLNDVFFNRMIDTTFSAFRGVNSLPNQQVGAIDIETPLSRRYMFGVISTFIDALDGNGQPAAMSYGDTIFENRIILHESNDVTVTANLNFRTPTGSRGTGNSQTAFLPYIGWYADLGFHGISFRGLVGCTDPLSGVNGSRVTTLNQSIALGQTLTPHDVPLLGDFTYYVVTTMAEAENTNTFLSFTPGIRTHLGRNWWLLVGFEVPVTADANYYNRWNFQLVKGF